MEFKQFVKVINKNLITNDKKRGWQSVSEKFK